EAIELKLRSLILRRIKDTSAIPTHVIQKVDERVGRALKKNAAMDAEKYANLEGKLEYFDLREIQETIANRALWKSFEPDFGNIETLTKKFDQLAELRNGIRHSRAVSDITRKEGEAAILWFNQILLKEKSA